MAITFNYAVKYEGKYYPPNTPIEVTPPTADKKPTATAETAQKPAKKRTKGDAQ